MATAACSTTGGSDVTGSIASAPSSSTPRTEAEWRRSLDMWGDRYKRNPNDVEAAIGYARALRATEQRAQAVAVLEQASIRNPNEMPLLGAYGRALADAGQYQQALDALGKAHTPDNPDWRILNAQGAVLDQMGRHADAQRHYTAALKIVPEEPSILSNLALSYVLVETSSRPRQRSVVRSRSRLPGRRFGKYLLWSWDCRVASTRPKRSHAPICRPARRKPMLLTCGRCSPSRVIGNRRRRAQSPLRAPLIGKADPSD